MLHVTFFQEIERHIFDCKLTELALNFDLVKDV
jgi:hypothetical protein